MTPNDMGDGNYGNGLPDILAMQQIFARYEEWICRHMQLAMTTESDLRQMADDDRIYLLKGSAPPEVEE